MIQYTKYLLYGILNKNVQPQYKHEKTLDKQNWGTFYKITDQYFSNTLRSWKTRKDLGTFTDWRKLRSMISMLQLRGYISLLFRHVCYFLINEREFKLQRHHHYFIYDQVNNSLSYRVKYNYIKLGPEEYFYCRANSENVLYTYLKESVFRGLSQDSKPHCLVTKLFCLSEL